MFLNNMLNNDDDLRLERSTEWRIIYNLGVQILGRNLPKNYDENYRSSDLHLKGYIYIQALQHLNEY